MVTSYPQYAFGFDTAEECPCPAFAAGFETSTNKKARAIADRYDAKVREYLHTDAMEQPEGTVPQDVAKGCWLDALEEAKREESDETVVRIGKKVARELGWSG